MKKHSLIGLIIAILIPLAVGELSALLSGGTSGDFQSPPLAPPGWVFPVVWTILYIMIGISSYIIWLKSDCKLTEALKTYIYQLIVNFCWPIVFFRFEYFSAAAVLLGVLILLVISNIAEFRKLDKTAAKLLLPYLIWCLFALYLNIGVAVLN